MTTVNRQKLKDTLIGQLARLPPTDQMWTDIFESNANLVDPNTFQADQTFQGAVDIQGALTASDLAVRVKLRNETGGELAKGTIVAVKVGGFNVTEGRATVVVADKDDAANRPAIAVTEAIVPDNANFDGLVVGLLEGLNTSAFSENDQLVLGDAGAVSRPPPDVDPFTGEIQLIGSVFRSDASNGSIYFTLASGLLPMTAAEQFAVKETFPTGNVSGGEVTRVSGLNVAVAVGNGFVNDDTRLFRVPYSAVSSLALTANDTNFIFVDKNGLVQASVSRPALGNNIVLAEAITDASSVIMLTNHQVLLRERPAKFHDYAKDVIGNVVVSGLITIKDAIAFRLQVDAGTFYVRDFKVAPPSTDPITFTYWFRDGSGGFTQVASSTLIDKDNFDDGSGTLAALLTTEFKKDLLFVVPTTIGTVEYHVFYGQEKFTSQSEAEAGNLPAADGDVIANGVRSGGVVIEGAAAAIASVVDVRPFVAQLAPGTTDVSDHGLLSGLGDNDHAIYLLRSILTTKGDIYVRDATGVIRVGVGADDQVLTADAAAASGVKWAAAGGAVSQLASWDANDAIFPATNPAAAISRNRHPVLVFGPTTAESVIFNDVMSRDYSAGSIMVDIDWVAATATTGDSVWGVEVERTAPGGNDIDTDSFAAQQTGTSTTNAASGVSTRTTITLTQAQADAIAAGDSFRLRVQRVAADAGDTMTGDAQILIVNMRQ